MITSKIPFNWKNLEVEVANILSQCGFNVEINKKIVTVRGGVVVDVYAEEIVLGRKYIIICECKYWKKKVPQTIVHSFRTICSDIGVHKGYIISIAGFQSGAYSSIPNTNIELVDWRGFQDLFISTWFNNYFMTQVTNNFDPIFSLTEPLFPSWAVYLEGVDIEKYKALRTKYLEFGILFMLFTTYHRILTDKNDIPRLPLKDQKRSGIWNIDFKKIPSNLLRAKGYMELLEIASNFAKKGIKHVNGLQKRGNSAFDRRK